MDEQRIICMSGKKQAGKNTACNFVMGSVLMESKLVRGSFAIYPAGELWISDLFGDTDYEGIIDPTRTDPTWLEFADEHIHPYVKIYSFADLLKTEVCMKILGLSKAQCFGTDEDKNTLTQLRWEDMPGVTSVAPSCEVKTIGFIDPKRSEQHTTDTYNEYFKKLGLPLVYHKPGLMTARQVLQFVGTEVFRKMYNNVWVDATIRRIQEEGSSFALICDGRFPNEITGVNDVGGKTIRFTRQLSGVDQHESELALDRDRFDWNQFSGVIDNMEMSIGEQNEALQKLFYAWGWGKEVNA